MSNAPWITDGGVAAEVAAAAASVSPTAKLTSVIGSPRATTAATADGSGPPFGDGYESDSSVDTSDDEAPPTYHDVVSGDAPPLAIPGYTPPSTVGVSFMDAVPPVSSSAAATTPATPATPPATDGVATTTFTPRRHQPAVAYTSAPSLAAFGLTMSEDRSSRRRRAEVSTTRRRIARRRSLPGTGRRYRRFLNALYLTPDRELTASELKRIFAVETRNMFTQVGRGTEMAFAWAPFVDTTEEEERAMLAGLRRARDDSSVDVGPSRRRAFEGTGPAGRVLGSPGADGITQQQTVLPELCYSRVDRRLRTVLRDRPDLPFITMVEEALLEAFFGPAEAAAAAAGGEAVVDMVIADSYHRLLFHAVCRFYALSSKSTNGADGQRHTIAQRAPGARVVRPAGLLADHLALLRGETA